MFNPKNIRDITSPQPILNINDFPLFMPMSIIGKVQAHILNDRMFRIFDIPNSRESYHFYVSPSRANINTSP